MSEIFSSAQAAEQLGCTPEAIRSCKSRKADQFSEGEHFIKQSNQTWWTAAGLELLRSLLTATPTVAPGNAERDSAATPDVASALSNYADQLAWSLLAQALPGAVARRLEQILINPSESDRNRLQSIVTHQVAVHVEPMMGCPVLLQLEGGK